MIRYLVISLLVPLLVSCASQTQRADGSPFKKHMYTDGLRLVHLVYMNDFVDLCEFYVVDHPEGFLQANGVEVRGPEGGEYIYSSDLLSLCGPNCNTESGLGIVLQHFLIKR